MNIGLDYDDTYTVDPLLWDWFILHAHGRGHRVYLTTMRDATCLPEDVVQHMEERGVVILPSSAKAKRPFAYAAGVTIDVWVDDTPRWVDEDIPPAQKWSVPCTGGISWEQQRPPAGGSDGPA